MCAALLMAACSTKKNTSGTRMFHSLTARFNTLYNGQVSYQEGMEAQLNGHQDDYTTLLPMFVATNAKTATLGRSNYENAITKCEKAIKLHSIKKRPQTNSSKKKTPKQKEFMQRKEFNPYLRHAWLMMGKAQFNQGDFIQAASTFNYIMRLYATQPEVYSVARAWLARCYVALEWPYDAEDVLNKMQRDSVSREGARERDASKAAFLIETGQYKEAVPLVKETISHTRNKFQKARLNFLTGQLYRELGDQKMAYKHLGKVIKANPPYELAFNARIAQSEVVAQNRSKAKAMVKKLTRMAKSDKNKDYLDQVYYAIGNIQLSIGDTAKCIGAWEKGAEESTRNGVAKAVLLLHLSELYWQQEKYIEAQRTYQACVGILDKEHDEYPEVQRRSKILDELEPHLSAIKLQDSLQALAKMPEAQYLAAIDRVIDALKKKEKEEAKKAGANGAAPGGGNAPGANPQVRPGITGNNAAAGNRKGAWYFYNPQTVMTGKQEFQRRWGNRKNEDNWRRSNKTEQVDDSNQEYNYDDDAGDSLQSDYEEYDEEKQRIKDSLANDPHHREFYLAQIPFTEEQMEASHQLLCDGLYHGGVLEMEKLENFPLSERTLLRVLSDYPDFESKVDVYYHLFLLYGRLGNAEEAERYRQLMLAEYPEDKKSVLLANPNYEMIAREGKHVEDSIYAATFDAYKENRYPEVMSNYAFHTDNFPEGKHRARIMFVHAMSNLYTGHRKEFLEELQEIVKTYGKDEVAEMASYIVKGMEEGRSLSSDKFTGSDIWKRRRVGVESGDSTQTTEQLSDERYSTFNFVLAYPTNSLDEDQLLFEVARYNFTSFMVRNFEIEILEDQGLSMMCVKGFLSFDEVHAYAQKLYSDIHMNAVLKGIRSVLISEDNLKLLGTSFSFDEYAEFYEQKFAPLNIPKDLIIDEPTDLEVIDPDDYVPEEQGEEVEEDEDDFRFGF